MFMVNTNLNLNMKSIIHFFITVFVFNMYSSLLAFNFSNRLENYWLNFILFGTMGHCQVGYLINFITDLMTITLIIYRSIAIICIIYNQLFISIIHSNFYNMEANVDLSYNVLFSGCL